MMTASIHKPTRSSESDDVISAGKPVAVSAPKRSSQKTTILLSTRLISISVVMISVLTLAHGFGFQQPLGGSIRRTTTTTPTFTTASCYSLQVQNKLIHHHSEQQQRCSKSSKLYSTGYGDDNDDEVEDGVKRGGSGYFDNTSEYTPTVDELYEEPPLMPEGGLGSPCVIKVRWCVLIFAFAYLPLVTLCHARGCGCRWRNRKLGFG
jgi:hypothetical protein